MIGAEFDNHFWVSDANHVATHPSRSEDADGLTEFAEQLNLDGFCFFQTSGSEGHPKWVGLPKRSFLISGVAVNAHFEVTAADRWLVALPLHHVGGFAIHARAHLSGAAVIQWDAPKWQPEAFVQSCRTDRITLVSLVPAQVHDLVRERLECPPSLRAAIIGGGGMTQPLADQAAALGWPTFQSYGMTEAASQIATQPYCPFGTASSVANLEVLPHWQLDLDSQGKLIVKGPALARGYARRAPGGSWVWEPIDGAAGLHTRDFVLLWDHGTRRFLQVVGRESGYVKILGELIHLAPLQARLDELALTAGFSSMPVIVALPDARRETNLVLVAEGSSSIDTDALSGAFNRLTEPLCHLNRIVLLPTIPRTSLGKVDVPELIRMLNG